MEFGGFFGKGFYEKVRWDWGLKNKKVNKYIMSPYMFDSLRDIIVLIYKVFFKVNRHMHPIRPCGYASGSNSLFGVTIWSVII